MEAAGVNIIPIGKGSRSISSRQLSLIGYSKNLGYENKFIFPCRAYDDKMVFGH